MASVGLVGLGDETRCLFEVTRRAVGWVMVAVSRKGFLMRADLAEVFGSRTELMELVMYFARSFCFRGATVALLRTGEPAFFLLFLPLPTFLAAYLGDLLSS